MSKISVKNDLSQWNASETIRYSCRARTMERVLPPLAEPTGGNPQVRSSYIQRINTYIQAFWLLCTILDFRFSAYVRRYISHWSRSKWSRVRYERYCLIGEKNSTAQDDRKLLGISRLKKSVLKCKVRQIAKTLVKRVCVVESKKGMSRRLICWRCSVKEKTVCLSPPICFLFACVFRPKWNTKSEILPMVGP